MKPYTLNRDQVKERLLRLEGPKDDFAVIFSGKSSKKVDGLYKPETREIILHTGNFNSDGELLYTAIHEFAHHIQFTSTPVPVSIRSHTNQFWSLFHSLLYKAEEMGLYRSVFEQNPEFVSLTARIRQEFLEAGGSLMKELGRLLLTARSLCEKYHASFQDYLDRVLCLPRNSARTIIKTHLYDLKPAIGFENMRTVARIGGEEAREQAQVALLEGQSPEMVKMQYLSRQENRQPLEALLLEKKRIERTINTLHAKLEELDRRIEQYSGQDNQQLQDTGT
ncbi:MAG TPA: hypothetical protein VMX75_12670 [Spirochaetia bacterium]|nr:hypothetical protein [Spirochaetia bacterium]